jgi:hypothetical protein
VDGAQQPVALPEVDSGDGSLRASQGEELVGLSICGPERSEG